MKTAIIAISGEGKNIADQLLRALSADSISRHAVAICWHDYDAFIFIGAMGICVRTIAPLVDDKHTDPAVVCIDSFGRNVISVLSGHVGGANDLTQRVADILGAHPVITTRATTPDCGSWTRSAGRTTGMLWSVVVT